MMSQKEQAERLKRELESKQKERIEVSMIEEAKEEVVKERLINEAIIREQLAEKGYLISVPDTEVILYEDSGYQLLYCNNIDNPKKINFIMALKQAVRPVTGRTAVTAQGYVAVSLPRDQFNLILASHQKHARAIKSYQERIKELEKQIAPLMYIDHLINKHKKDTQGE